jgi:Rap1a immunity proteins
MDGNDLLAKRQSSNSHERSLCLGYIEGVVDDLNENRATNGAKTGCPDEEHVLAGQLRDAVVNSLMANPAGRNLEASALVAIAIGRAWHCAAQ